MNRATGYGRVRNRGRRSTGTRKKEQKKKEKKKHTGSLLRRIRNERRATGDHRELSVPLQ